MRDFLSRLWAVLALKIPVDVSTLNQERTYLGLGAGKIQNTADSLYNLWSIYKMNGTIKPYFWATPISYISNMVFSYWVASTISGDANLLSGAKQSAEIYNAGYNRAIRHVGEAVYDGLANMVVVDVGTGSPNDVINKLRGSFVIKASGHWRSANNFASKQEGHTFIPQPGGSSTRLVLHTEIPYDNRDKFRKYLSANGNGMPAGSGISNDEWSTLVEHANKESTALPEASRGKIAILIVCYQASVFTGFAVSAYDAYNKHDDALERKDTNLANQYWDRFRVYASMATLQLVKTVGVGAQSFIQLKYIDNLSGIRVSALAVVISDLGLLGTNVYSMVGMSNALAENGRTSAYQKQLIEISIAAQAAAILASGVGGFIVVTAANAMTMASWQYRLAFVGATTAGVVDVVSLWGSNPQDGQPSFTIVALSILQRLFTVATALIPAFTKVSPVIVMAVDIGAQGVFLAVKCLLLDNQQNQQLPRLLAGEPASPATVDSSTPMINEPILNMGATHFPGQQVGISFSNNQSITSFIQMVAGIGVGLDANYYHGNQSKISVNVTGLNP